MWSFSTETFSVYDVNHLGRFAILTTDTNYLI